MREKYKYLGKNTLVFAISSFGTKFLSFLIVPLYTNILTTAEYGVADIVTTTATLMIYIFTINIAEAVLRCTLERKERQNEILAYGIYILIIGSFLVIVSLIIVWLSGLIKWENSYYIFVFGYFFFTALYQILTNYLRATDKVTSVARTGVISSLVMLICNVLFLVVIRIGIYGYLISMILGPVIGSGYAMYKIKLPVSMYFNNCCDAETKRTMKKFCIPLIFNNIALWINAFLDKYFVTAICGIEQNGIYAVAYKIPTILAMCYSVFSQAWSLSAVKEFDRNDKDGFFSDTYKMYNAFIVCVCSVLILINIPLAKLLYAKDFFTAWKYSSVLLIFVMFNAITAFMGSIFSAVKNSKIIAGTTLISAAVNIVLNIILIPSLGVLGAAIATAVCYAVMFAIRSVVLKKYIVMRVTIWKDILAYVLICLQVVFEHIGNHCYIAQVLILITIIVLYMDCIGVIIGKIHEKHKNKKVKNERS